MISQAEIHEIASQIELTIDNPQSVRRQLRKLNLIRQQLGLKKREIRQELQNLKTNPNQNVANDVLRASMPFLPRDVRKWRGVINVGAREINRARQNATRQPYLELQNLIDDYLLEIDNLRLEAQEYLSQQE